MTKQSICPLYLAATLAGGLLLSPAGLAQSSGVSHPPPDDTIEASQDAMPAQTKPSPGVPVRQNYAPPAGSTPAVSPTDDPNSPDYGIVTSVPGSSPAATAPASRDAHLVARPENPDYGIVEMIPSPSNQLAEGTDIRVRLLQSLSTSATQSGTAFRAQVAADVYKEGRVVIPVGSELRGRVMSVSQGHRLGTPATMRLRPEAIVLPDGTAYHLYAQAVRTDAPGVRTDDEGALQPSSRINKDLVELGAGSGGGAATGAIFGGPAGAAAGALVGAGIVTAHLLIQHPHEARVEQGSEITFSLTEPMDLLPTRN
jgi:hypothetical protein